MMDAGAFAPSPPRWLRAAKGDVSSQASGGSHLLRPPRSRSPFLGRFPLCVQCWDVTWGGCGVVPDVPVVLGLVGGRGHGPGVAVVWLGPGTAPCASTPLGTKGVWKEGVGRK